MPKTKLESVVFTLIMVFFVGSLVRLIFRSLFRRA